MNRVLGTDQSLQLRISELETENRELYQIIQQLNSTLQKLISVYIQPDIHESGKTFRSPGP